MLKFLARRFLYLIPTIIVISMIVFGMVASLPGDPTSQYMNPNSSTTSPEQVEKQREEIRARLGLDLPIHQRYLRWTKTLFVEGEFGTSMVYNERVEDLLPYYIKNTFILNLTAFIIAYLIAIPVGIRSAVKRGKKFDNFWQVFSTFGISLPSFFVAMLLTYILGIQLELFPITGMVTAGYNHVGIFDYITDLGAHMFMPVLVIVLLSVASTLRYVRNSMVEVIKSDYIRTARSKGLSEKVVIYSHAFRNALIPLVTLICYELPALFAGSVVLENIFKWPGVGRILIEAITKQDNAVIITITLFYTALSLTANILMDIGYALVDPKVRLD